MAEYINRDQILHDPMMHTYRKKDLLDKIKSMPAADVAPVVHGRWEHLGGDEWCCTHCGCVISTEGSWEKPEKKYCDNCGAKMDGGANDGCR